MCETRAPPQVCSRLQIRYGLIDPPSGESEVQDGTRTEIKPLYPGFGSGLFVFILPLNAAFIQPVVNISHSQPGATERCMLGAGFDFIFF